MIFIITAGIIIIYDLIILVSIRIVSFTDTTAIITIILNTVLISIIINKLFDCIIHSKNREFEFEKIVELFDISNNINLINRRIDEYDSKINKQILINKIIRILIKRKRNDLKIIMKENLKNYNIPITKEIIKKELELIEINLTSYKNNLNVKMICIIGNN